MGQDNHTRDLIAWYDQVIADRGLTLFAFHVAFTIGQHVNRQSQDAWPSQGRIAEILSASRRGVQMAIDQLAERGHLGVTVQRGRNGSNKYRPRLKHAEIEPRNDGLNAHDGAHITPDNAHGDAHLNHDGAHGDAHLNHDGAHGDAHPLRTGVRTNHLREPSEGDSLSPSNSSPEGKVSAKRSRKAKADPSEFDAWWNAYPRKVEKLAARQAYDRAISKTGVSPAELLAAAERFAAERDGEDPKWTKYPATWLNAGSWADEAVDPHPSTGADGARPRGAFSLMERYAIGDGDDE